MKNSNEAMRAGYSVAKCVYEGTLTRAAGRDELHKRFSLNRSSAMDTIRNVIHMLNGESYARTMNAFASEHFLEMIYRDFGAAKLSKAISAVRQHLEYYQSLDKGSNQPAIRKIVEKYQALVGAQVKDVPPAVRILPMNRRKEFPNYASVADLQNNFFLNVLPSRQDGHYFYRKSGLDTVSGAIVLFQSDNQIVASAKFLDSKALGQPNSAGYRGRLFFDIRSIKVFDPVDAAGIKRAWPSFQGFDQVKQHLDADGYSTFEQGLNGVQTPVVWLNADEADSGHVTEEQVAQTGRIDRRLLVERQIRQRRGQNKFRMALRKRYGDRCLVTGCEVVDVLEAAHIKTSPGKDDNHPENGLLLRADIHTLFDLDLLGIEPEHLHICLHPDVSKEYGHLNGSPLLCDAKYQPSRDALKSRYSLFCKRRGPEA